MTRRTVTFGSPMSLTVREREGEGVAKLLNLINEILSQDVAKESFHVSSNGRCN